MPILESLEVLEEKVPSLEQPEPVPQEDPASQSSSSSNVTIPLKPKPARRKKKEGDSSERSPASVEPTTKRRGRKKSQPEILAVIEPKPEIVEEPVIPVQTVSQDERVEEPPIPIEPISEPEPVPKEWLRHHPKNQSRMMSATIFGRHG